MSNELTPKGYLGSQVERRFAVGGRDNVTPPLPEKIGIEINNSCNHQCYFCPNPTMERQRSVMNDDMVRRVVHEAYDAGIHQISFYSGGEPFLNRKLADYVLHAKDLGFDYCYLSSNGGKAVTGRLRKVLEAGLDSLKFSINGGDRATYHAVHGRDEFEDVVRNVEFVANYREKYNPNLKLFISFVQTPLNRMSFEKLKRRWDLWSKK